MMKFIEELDAAKREAIRTHVGGTAFDQLAAMSPLDWTELARVERMLDAMVEANGGPSTTVEVGDRLGRAIAHAATNTLLRLFMKVATPAMVSKQMKPLWRKFFSFGTFEIETLNARGAIYTVEDGFKYAPAVGRGWMGYVMDAIGRRGVVVKCEPESGVLPEGGGRTRWRVDWGN
jgi:hypothetical protein